MVGLWYLLAVNTLGNQGEGQESDSPIPAGGFLGSPGLTAGADLTRLATGGGRGVVKLSCMELSKPLDYVKKAVPHLLQHADTCESKIELFREHLRTLK